MKKKRPPKRLLVALVPLAAIDTALKALALRDLARRDRRVRWGRKAFWVPLIAGVNTLGWLTYFLFGRVKIAPAAEA